MNLDLFLNLTTQVIRIVLADAYHGESLVHSWIDEDQRPHDWPPFVCLSGASDGLWLTVTVYDRILNTAATRYRTDSACGTKNRPEYTCVDSSDLLVPA